MSSLLSNSYSPCSTPKTGYGRPVRLVSPAGATLCRHSSPLGQLLLWAAGGQDHLLELQGFPGPARFAWLKVELVPGRSH